MKDHEIAQLVNRLTVIARDFGHTQQLRERIAQEIRPLASQRTEQQPNPWRQAVDEALIAHALDCTGPGDDPKEKVKELLEWAVTIATDPRVAEPRRMREVLWALVEHNALHFGENHSTVIQGRTALAADKKGD